MKASELINLICRDLPEGYEIIIDLALHSGDVTLQDPFSDEVDFPSNREDIEAELRDALAYAIEHDKEHHNEYFTED